MRMMGAALLGLTLAASAAVLPASAQQTQNPGVLDQARRMLGGTDDQEAQQRAFEAGRRAEQQRQMERDRDRRPGDYEARRGYDDQRGSYDDRRGSSDRRGYGTGSDMQGRPTQGSGPYGDRVQPGPTYDRERSDRSYDPAYRR